MLPERRSPRVLLKRFANLSLDCFCHNSNNGRDDAPLIGYAIKKSDISLMQHSVSFLFPECTVTIKIAHKTIWMCSISICTVTRCLWGNIVQYCILHWASRTGQSAARPPEECPCSPWLYLLGSSKVLNDPRHKIYVPLLLPKAPVFLWFGGRSQSVLFPEIRRRNV